MPCDPAIAFHGELGTITGKNLLIGALRHSTPVLQGWFRQKTLHYRHYSPLLEGQVEPPTGTQEVRDATNYCSDVRIGLHSASLPDNIECIYKVSIFRIFLLAFTLCLVYIL